MITFVCSEGESCCKYSVREDDEYLYILGVRMRCPKNPNHVLGIQSSEEEGFRISARLLHDLCMGLGMPEERSCSPEEVRALLTGSKIHSVSLHRSINDKERSIITDMVLETAKGALRVHIGSSVHGATIYRMEDL